MIEWYEGDDLTTETVEDVRNKLVKLLLSTRRGESQYINDFQTYSKHLHELSEAYTPFKTITIFINQFSDPNYQNGRDLQGEQMFL